MLITMSYIFTQTVPYAGAAVRKVPKSIQDNVVSFCLRGAYHLPFFAACGRRGGGGFMHKRAGADNVVTAFC